MFTGIVEELGEVLQTQQLTDAAVITVRAPAVASGVEPGHSVAVNGVCLTVVTTDRERGVFSADVMAETLRRTTLGTLRPGDPVNLEQAATLATRLGGHLVQGHVDGVGTVLERRPTEHWTDLRVGLPAGLARYVVEKGSIAVDGVSLTVVSVDDSGQEDPSGGSTSFTVSLIPTTLRLTTLGRRQVGELVNLEVDIMAKYVEKLVASRETV